MKRKLFVVLLCALAAVVPTSCTIYHPQAVDIPLINHAEDVRVDASVALSTWLLPDVFTVNGTVSYGFNDWLAGQAHFNFGGDNVYGQLAPGAYFPLGAKSVVETYAGLGMGGSWRDNVSSSHARHSDNEAFSSYSFSGHYMLPFVQGNIGWHDLTKAHIDLAFGLKLGAFLPDFDYKEFDENDDMVDGSQFRYTTGNFLVEPQLLFRIGGEKVRFNIKAGMAWLSDIYDDNGKSGKFTADIFTLSCGFTFSF